MSMQTESPGFSICYGGGISLRGLTRLRRGVGTGRRAVPGMSDTHHIWEVILELLYLETVVTSGTRITDRAGRTALHTYIE